MDSPDTEDMGGMVYSQRQLGDLAADGNQVHQTTKHICQLGASGSQAHLAIECIRQLGTSGNHMHLAVYIWHLAIAHPAIAHPAITHPAITHPAITHPAITCIIPSLPVSRNSAVRTPYLRCMPSHSPYFFFF